MTVSPRIWRAWPTVVWAQVYDRPELDRALVPLAHQIATDAARDGKYFFSRRKGNCFRDRQDDALRDLGRLAFAGVRDYLGRVYGAEEAAPRLEIAGWPMVQPYGHAVPAHHHVGSHLTAIYYCAVPPVRADTPIPNSGHLILHDPRAANRDWEPRGTLAREFKYFEVAVETGLLVIFPGYVMHSVQPWFGAAPRVCYAMNIMVHRAYLEEPGMPEADFEARHG